MSFEERKGKLKASQSTVADFFFLNIIFKEADNNLRN